MSGPESRRLASDVRTARPGGWRPGAFLALGPALVVLVAVFYFGSIDQDPMQLVQFDAKDKVLHALAFGIVQRTHYRAAEFLFRAAPEKKLAFGSFVSAALVGIALEIWQAFLPHRSADVLDALADAAGAAVFAIAFSAFGGRRATGVSTSDS